LMSLSSSAPTQDELKTLVGRAALQYVEPGSIVGVGTGSTVNKFIDALADVKQRIRGAVSSSEASTARLRALGIAVFDANEVDALAVYIDGADEIDPRGYMIKGGGAALTREKSSPPWPRASSALPMRPSRSRCSDAFRCPWR